MALAASINKVLDGLPLDPEEGLELYLEAELPILGMLADRVRKRFHDDGIVTYIVDRNVNPTNVCVTDCGFCAFYRRPGHKEAYVLDDEELEAKIRGLKEAGGVQLLLQGGHHPGLKVDWFADLFRRIKSRHPDIWIHGMSPPEIVHLAKLGKCTPREVLRTLQEAGLDSMPGGGAEILVDRVRGRIAPKKASAEEWLEVMRQAADLGMRTTATMMFGTVETPRERVEHLERIRALQEECGVFTAFIPWTFQPDHTPMETEWRREGGGKATAAEYLRMLAFSRIYLHNIENIQSSWVTQGIKICQIGLGMGANDFGSAMLEENVVSSAGCDNMTTLEEIERHIEDAGFIPRRRDMLYRILDEENRPLPGTGVRPMGHGTVRSREAVS